MQNIKPFINLGWYTVPLKGELKRREDGSKTEPKFEKAWKEKYKQQKNEIASKIGGVMTGSKSNIIAIDCDNDATYELFHSLDPDYSFIFKSKGKLNKDGTEKHCGTIVYEFDENFPDSFSINDGTIALDVYAENGFVYLPTEANETKEAWNGQVPKLKELPAATLLLLRQLQKTQHAAPKLATNKQNTMTANCLAPLVKQFVDGRKFMPGLFKILTPKDFRDEPQYQKEGYLHPENIPEGRGSEYLSKVSAILGADISIDEELYNAAIHDINDLWLTPMDADRLDATITDPMVSGKSSVDGVPIWQYDENWSAFRLVLHTKRQSSIELGFDDRRDMYYCVDVANEHVKAFNKDNDLISYISAVSMNAPKKPELKNALPIINVTSTPNKTFGFHADDDPTARTLNTFIRTPELNILAEPEPYEPLYKRPTITLKFLETLVPEQEMRTYLLRFLKRKLTTFEYSPVMLYFLGVQGSGKDTFVELLEKIMSKVSRPTTKEFLEVYNSWLLDTYFVQLDEYGDQLTTIRDKEEAFGKLKAYTGKKTIQIRAMRTDGFEHPHAITFISTANRNPFGLEDGDRRIALFDTPNKLLNADWVDDITQVHEQIMAESKDFCYYLATEIQACNSTEYMQPPETASKHKLIADSMYAAHKLAYVMKHNMLDYLKDLAISYSCDRVIKAISNRRIYADDMEELYEVMTDYKGNMRSLNKAVRGIGVEIKDSSSGGQKRYYYNIEAFKGGPFDAEEE